MQAIGDEQHVVIHTDWRGYQMMIEVAGEQPGLRLTYDRGELEIMTTSHEHERRKSLLGRLLEVLMLQRGMDFLSGGAQTFQHQRLDRGFEPDECYWIANWKAVLHMGRYWDPSYPPPDLAVEVEVSRGLVNRLGIYRAMGVPEVWRQTMQRDLEILILTPEGYVPQSASPTFPNLLIDEVARYARMENEQAASQILRHFQGWLAQKD